MRLLLRRVWVGFSGLFVFFFLQSRCQAQPLADESHIRKISVDEGLPQGWVFNLVQDKKGFIWLGADGLYRYDGYTFKKYQHTKGDTASLSGEELYNINIDDKDNLLLSYYQGKTDIYNIGTGKVRHLSTEPGFSWVGDTVTYLVNQGSNYFYGSLYTFGKIDLATGAHQPFHFPSGEYVTGMGANAKGETIVSTQYAFYRIAGKALQKIANCPVLSQEAYTDWAVKRLRGHQPVSKIILHPTGRLITAAYNGLFTYNPATGKTDYLTDDKTDVAPVYNLVQAIDGNTYFLKGNNLYRLDKKLTLSLYSPETERNKLFEPLLADRSGILWTATMDATGLRLINTHPATFHSYFSKKSFLYEILKKFLPELVSTSTYSSYSLRFAKDVNGRAWFLCPTLTSENRKLGFYDNKVFHYDNHQLQLISLGITYVSSIAFTKTNQCWVIGNKETTWYLGKVDVTTGAFSPKLSFSRPNWDNGFLTAIASKLAMVEENTMTLYDTATRQTITYTKEQLGADNKLLMAATDPRNDSILWIATKGSGIVRLNIFTRQKRNFNKDSGLPDNTVYYMAADKKGFFWCSSNLGIFRFDPIDGRVESFTKQAGLQGNEFNRYHFFEMPDGQFAFGGPEGYTTFYPDSVQVDKFQPSVAISNILVNNVPLEQTSATWKDTSISALKEITLPYNQNLVSINFASLQYNSPDKTLYRYQLEGVDKGWVKAGMTNSVSYTFAPGHYSFKVNAANTAGIWSDQITTLEITILPPWWRTNWAYILYTVLFFSLGYVLYLNWVRRIQSRQKIVLQQKEAEQLKAMDEMKSRFFSNITHEFRTPLTLITAPLEEMQRKGVPEEMKPKLQGVQRNAEQLLHLINQLLDMAKLEANSMPVNLQRGNLYQFVQAVCDSFLPRAASKGLFIRVESSMNEEAEHLFDSDKLQKIMTNLLSNAIKFTPADGEVSVVIQEVVNDKGEPTLSISVADTGIGIPPEKLSFIFNRFYQADNSHTRTYEGTGIGLALVKELTERLNGTITVAGNPSGTGTTFLLSLPLLPATGSEATTALPEQSIRFYNEEPVAQTGETDTSSDKPLILVTEDNLELRAFIAGSLGNDYRVITAENGKQGLEAAMQEMPDIIISDARMPEMDGFQFCQSIKQRPETSHIAFILLTAKTTQQSRIEGLQSQADDYLTKPFQVEELQLRIRNILQRQQQLRVYYNRQLTTPEEPLVTTKQEDPLLQRLYAYLEQNLEETDLTVEKMAASVRISQRTLTRKLNSIAGISGVELIKQYRLKKAAALLLNGSSVSEAAFATGYDNPNYFSTAFKNFYELAPTEYVRKFTKAG